MVNHPLEALAWRTLSAVPDPEIPVISVVDLGIVRFVRSEVGTLEIGISPTYSGCPATDVIRADIEAAIKAAGISDARIVEVLSPPWTTDWITPEGLRSLQDYGIAPPLRLSRAAHGAPAVACPQCHSHETEQISEFGSTPCKALHRCRSCLEPFERFKCL